MTVPYERYRAVLNAEDFLFSLTDPKKTPRVPSDVRRLARSVLKHYPSKFDMERVCEALPSVFAKEFIIEDKNNE